MTYAAVLIWEMWWWVLVLFLLSAEAGAKTSTTPTYLPSCGDLKRDKNGLLWMYMGPDGTNLNITENLKWGTLNGNGATDQTFVENTLCHQLGYSNGRLYTQNHTELSKNPVWLSGITCTKEYDHILRCGHDPISSTNNHGYDIHLDCYDSYDHAKYKGQVSLVPPTVVKNMNASVSHGVITLTTRREKDSQLYIQGTTLDYKVANTVCRQLGYTSAVQNSIMTKWNSQRSYGYQYNLTVTAALNSSHLSCLEPSQCIGCCIKNWTTIHGLHSVPDQALTIRCTFFEELKAANPYGYKAICEVSEGGKIQNSGVCHKKNWNFNDTKWLLVDLGLTVFVIIILIIFVVFTRWLYLRCRRAGYQNLNGNGGRGRGNGRGNGGGNGDGGNGRGNGGGNGNGGGGRGNGRGNGGD